jgi:hypothetical protein
MSLLVNGHIVLQGYILVVNYAPMKNSRKLRRILKGYFRLQECRPVPEIASCSIRFMSEESIQDFRNIGQA